MAANFQTATSGGSASSASTVVVNKPSGVVDGDLLIVAIGSNDGVSNDTVTGVPSGWTLIDSDTSLASGGSAISRMDVYWKVASSEGASWTWTFSGANMSHTWISARFDNFNTVTTIDAHNIAHQDNTTTPTWANTITPTISTDLLAAFVWAPRSQSTTITSFAIATNNPTWATQLTQAGAGGTMALFTATRPETTATGNSSATLGASGAPVTPSICEIIAIGRINNFTATITETVTVSDSVTVNTGYTATITETVTVTDTVTVDKTKNWTSPSKHNPTWTDGTKH